MIGTFRYKLTIVVTSLTNYASSGIFYLTNFPAGILDINPGALLFQCIIAADFHSSSFSLGLRRNEK